MTNALYTRVQKYFDFAASEESKNKVSHCRGTCIECKVPEGPVRSSDTPLGLAALLEFNRKKQSRGNYHQVGVLRMTPYLFR